MVWLQYSTTHLCKNRLNWYKFFVNTCISNFWRKAGHYYCISKILTDIPNGLIKLFPNVLIWLPCWSNACMQILSFTNILPSLLATTADGLLNRAAWNQIVINSEIMQLIFTRKSFLHFKMLRKDTSTRKLWNINKYIIHIYIIIFYNKHNSIYNDRGLPFFIRASLSKCGKNCCFWNFTSRYPIHSSTSLSLNPWSVTYFYHVYTMEIKVFFSIWNNHKCLS